MNRKDYIELADFMRTKAYAPYSNFHVGAVLICDDQKIYTGCNIENSSYGVSICAERVALVKAISEGSHDIKQIIIIGDSEEYCVPCGICRQMLYEFNPNLQVICCNVHKEYKEYILKDLLLDGFHL